jgi:hypothetical protein
MTTLECLQKIRQLAPHMTITSISEILGVDKARIGILCKKYGIQPISQSEETIGFIREKAGKKTLSQIAKALDMHEVYVEELAKKNSITLMKELPTEQKPPDKVKKYKSTHVNKVSTLPELKALAADIMAGRTGGNLELIEVRIMQLEGTLEVPKYRGKDTYTQSGSPYGIADEMRRIKIK